MVVVAMAVCNNVSHKPGSPNQMLTDFQDFSEKSCPMEEEW